MQQLPRDRQTLLFSATLHTTVQKLASLAMRPGRPLVVSVHKEALISTPTGLLQTYVVVELREKVDVLFSFLRAHSQQKTLVFVSAGKQVRTHPP